MHSSLLRCLHENVSKYTIATSVPDQKLLRFSQPISVLWDEFWGYYGIMDTQKTKNQPEKDEKRPSPADLAARASSQAGLQTFIHSGNIIRR